MFKIKDFGQDRLVGTFPALLAVLSKEYKGKSVGVMYKKSSGISAALYVSVSADGVIRESYGSESEITADYERLLA